MITKTILHLTPFFSPNIGGVETHLSDLTQQLDYLGYRNIVLTYSPITTNNVGWKSNENFSSNIFIRRFNWFGHNLFTKLERYPFLNLIYITPYLFIRSFFWLLFHSVKIDVIHSHGLNAALIGIFIKKIFKIKKHIVSIYSSYDNVPLSGFSTKLLATVLNHSDHVLTQSDRSLNDLIRLGVNPKILSRYYHWIDLKRFKPILKQHKHQFSILFVGRLIPQKNALLLAKVAKSFPKLKFVFVGTGPDYHKLLKLSRHQKNISLLGNIPYSSLQTCYQSVDLFCLPSKYDEGWGRVVMESVACGTPAICTNLGATYEAVDSSVALFVSPTEKDLTSAIQKIINDHDYYQQLKSNCRPFALKHFSSKNISYITSCY